MIQITYKMICSESMWEYFQITTYLCVMLATNSLKCTENLRQAKVRDLIHSYYYVTILDVI